MKVYDGMPQLQQWFMLAAFGIRTFGRYYTSEKTVCVITQKSRNFNWTFTKRFK